MTAALTITRGSGNTTRKEYDENDQAARDKMAREFDAVVRGSLGYKTPRDSGESVQIRQGEFPPVGEEAEIVVSPQYAGG